MCIAPKHIHVRARTVRNERARAMSEKFNICLRSSLMRFYVRWTCLHACVRACDSRGDSMRQNFDQQSDSFVVRQSERKVLGMSGACVNNRMVPFPDFYIKLHQSNGSFPTHATEHTNIHTRIWCARARTKKAVLLVFRSRAHARNVLCTSARTRLFVIF